VRSKTTSVIKALGRKRGKDLEKGRCKLEGGNARGKQKKIVDMIASIKGNWREKVWRLRGRADCRHWGEMELTKRITGHFCSVVPGKGERKLHPGVSKRARNVSKKYKKKTSSRQKRC